MNGDSLVTVSFQRGAITCRSLIALDLILESVGDLDARIDDMPMSEDIPQLVLFWLERLDSLDAFEPDGGGWNRAEFNFMRRLWDAHQAYYQEITDPGRKQAGNPLL